MLAGALRTRSGKVFSAVHLEAYIGRVAVCAEAVAIGMGAAAGDTDIELIVAVNRAGDVVAPCGMCRELISDYAPQAEVCVSSATGPTRVQVSVLLPGNKYARAVMPKQFVEITGTADSPIATDAFFETGSGSGSRRRAVWALFRVRFTSCRTRIQPVDAPLPSIRSPP